MAKWSSAHEMSCSCSRGYWFEPGLLNYYSVPITITITIISYINSLLLLLLQLHRVFKQPITITITSYI